MNPASAFGAERKCWHGSLPAAIGVNVKTYARREPFSEVAKRDGTCGLCGRLAELAYRDFVTCALSSAASLDSRTRTGRLGVQATQYSIIAHVPASLKA
jgi:hypothetical protein